MLTNEQIDVVVQCIREGQEVQIDFEDASTCEVLDAILDHLDYEKCEVALGLSDAPLQTATVCTNHTTDEDKGKEFMHHVMHWAFALGVGAALHAVGQDMQVEGE